jgi:type IV secretory pathway VirB10-like protein
MLSEASQSVVAEAGGIFESLPPIIGQAMQLMQQLAPQMPQDPRVAIEGQKLQAQTQRDQQQMQLEGQKTQAQMQLEGQKMAAQAQQDQIEAQLQQQKLQIEQQLEQMKQDREDARKSAEINARMTMNQQDNQTAMQLAQAEIMSGERIAVSTGTGINPNP